MCENKFGYESMLEIKTEFNPSDKQLNQLAESMIRESEGIPAGYTYLGQFIDHDISLDSANIIFPAQPISPSTIFNKRTSFLELETIYGSEKPRNENEPSRTQLLKDNSKTLLKLGDTVAGNSVHEVFVGKDLPRIPGTPHALIVDSRNDENLAVAQTQVAFMRFHNSVVEYLKASDSTETFEEARKIVIQHYQWIILNDYLPRVIKKSVLRDVLANSNQFYFPDPKTPFVPLEFSAAAFRFGHSMIRSSYNWNRIFNDDENPSLATIKELTTFTGRGGLEGRTNLISDWVINWNWFYKTSESEGLKFNYAMGIDTKISRPLGRLPGATHTSATGFDRQASLPAIDLYRTRALGLPTGQMVAKTILGAEEKILKPEQLANLLPASLRHAFSKETPLWFYLLAEAEIEEGGKNLGEVGSRIVAETFAKLISLSEFSILDKNFHLKFHPNPNFFKGEPGFGMRQMLRFIACDGGCLGELNPLEDENKVSEGK